MISCVFSVYQRSIIMMVRATHSIKQSKQTPTNPQTALSHRPQYYFLINQSFSANRVFGLSSHLDLWANKSPGPQAILLRSGAGYGRASSHSSSQWPPPRLPASPLLLCCPSAQLTGLQGRLPSGCRDQRHWTRSPEAPFLCSVTALSLPLGPLVDAEALIREVAPP